MISSNFDLFSKINGQNFTKLPQIDHTVALYGGGERKQEAYSRSKNEKLRNINLCYCKTQFKKGFGPAGFIKILLNTHFLYFGFMDFHIFHYKTQDSGR